MDKSLINRIKSRDIFKDVALVIFKILPAVIIFDNVLYMKLKISQNSNVAEKQKFNIEVCIQNNGLNLKIYPKNHLKT